MRSTKWCKRQTKPIWGNLIALYREANMTLVTIYVISHDEYWATSTIDSVGINHRVICWKLWPRHSYVLCYLLTCTSFAFKFTFILEVLFKELTCPFTCFQSIQYIFHIAFSMIFISVQVRYSIVGNGNIFCDNYN